MRAFLQATEAPKYSAGAAAYEVLTQDLLKRLKI